MVPTSRAGRRPDHAHLRGVDERGCSDDAERQEEQLERAVHETAGAGDHLIDCQLDGRDGEQSTGEERHDRRDQRPQRVVDVRAVLRRGEQDQGDDEAGDDRHHQRQARVPLHPQHPHEVRAPRTRRSRATTAAAATTDRRPARRDRPGSPATGRRRHGVDRVELGERLAGCGQPALGPTGDVVDDGDLVQPQPRTDRRAQLDPALTWMSRPPLTWAMRTRRSWMSSTESPARVIAVPRRVSRAGRSGYSSGDSGMATAAIVATGRGEPSTRIG